MFRRNKAEEEVKVHIGYAKLLKVDCIRFLCQVQRCDTAEKFWLALSPRVYTTRMHQMQVLNNWSDPMSDLIGSELEVEMIMQGKKVISSGITGITSGHCR
jgi:hypothetical protein